MLNIPNQIIKVAEKYNLKLPNDRKDMTGDVWCIGNNFILKHEGSYPPYDIVKDSDYNYRIVMAIAGFTEDDITVEKKEQVLTIEGQTTIEDSYIYKGIASRKFKKVFPLAESADVVSASLKNGLLEVNIEVTIPEDKKPKLIDISID